MQETKRYILCTRPLAKDIVLQAARQNVVIEELSFIDTHPIETKEVTDRVKALAGENCTVVFTSMNAVEAVAAQVKLGVSWKVYCIGNTTKKLIEERLASATIIATGENAERLAERLVDDGVKKAVFFCGNIRRDELPNKIRSDGGTVEEVIVYQTIEKPSAVTKEYDGILFFSPSAVNSFFKSNKVPVRTELFAIGKTTADTLRKYANKKIIVAGVTGKQELVQHAIDFFNNKNTQA
jgi:uroporphyrinogen-III synthase